MFNRSNFLIRLLLIFFLSLSIFFVNAQQLNTAIENAYIITRMAEKFHVQPRPLNDTFSSNIFTQLLKQLDEDKIFFTAEDIKALSKYKFDIDDEIRNKQSAFLSAIIKIFGDRISKADTMIDNICKKPFNFLLPEKIIVAEDTSYPADERAMRIKLYKLLKSEALDIIIDDDELVTLNSPQQKKYIDSIEPSARHKAQQSFKHAISVMLQSAGGIEQAIGDEYCKAIAVCYDPHSEYFPLTEKEDFDIAEQSFDEMQAFLLLQEKINEKLDEANDKMKTATDAFAKKYNVNLIESKTDLVEKLDESGKLNHYRNQLYLIYFKCYWEDGQIVKALNAGKITEAEQGRNSLIKFADEGLVGMDSLKNFEGDPALAATCREILKFYKEMAENDMPKQMDYFLKKENFEKIKKSFDAKSESDRTKKDVDAFNDGVKEINKATDTYNATNKKMDSERTDAENKWNDAEKSFADTHMPYYK